MDEKLGPIVAVYEVKITLRKGDPDNQTDLDPLTLMEIETRIEDTLSEYGFAVNAEGERVDA